MTERGRAPHLTTPVGERDHALGPETAPVTLVEYCDFECPYTRRAERSLKSLRERLGDRLRIVYRNFPLRSVHPHAQHAALAAETAAVQGKYWEMHDLLFERQHWLDDEHLAEYARTLSLDVDRFQEELALGVRAPRIEEDLESGIESGVEGTPTIFINGELHAAPYDEESLLEVIEQALPTG